MSSRGAKVETFEGRARQHACDMTSRSSGHKSQMMYSFIGSWVPFGGDTPSPSVSLQESCVSGAAGGVFLIHGQLAADLILTLMG